MDLEQVSGGLIFIVFGTLFLASQLGYLPWDVIGTFVKFWPLLLVIPGLFLVFSKK